ncbi:MAG: hypothetical protein ACYS71_07960 [Planctomycetota bacterium]
MFQQLETYFPELFGVSQTDYLENKKVLLLKMLKRIKGEEAKELTHYQDAVFRYEGSPNAEKMIKFEKNLTGMVDSLAEHFPSVDPFEVSVFRFYSTVSRLKDAKTKTSQRKTQA